MKLRTVKILGKESNVKQFYDIKPSPICVKALQKLSFEVNIEYAAGEKPVSKVYFKTYYRKANSNAPFRLLEVEDGKDYIELKGNLVSLETGFDENLAGAELAISFGVLNPYMPPFQNSHREYVGTVKYINLLSSEKGTPQIKSAVWSVKEEVVFGKRSLERKDICRNEDGFLHIETRGMLGQKVKVELFEKDLMPPKMYLLLGKKDNIEIWDNVVYVPIEMDGVYHKADKLRALYENGSFDIVARITPLDTSISSFDSTIINLQIGDKALAEKPAISTVSGTQKFIIGNAEDGNNKEQTCKCPRCRELASDMQKRLKKCFPNADDDVLKQISEAYCKYMTELKMDTCWIKAHFFAQIAIETGIDLKPKAESMNYSVNGLSAIFGARFTKEERQKYGRTDLHKADQKMIANIAYGGRFGNNSRNTDDGWNYRGKGLIQLTFKDNYEKVRSRIMAKGLGDIIKNPDLLITNYEVATYASMLYLYDRGIVVKKDQSETQIANGQKQTLFVSKSVGKEHKTKKDKSTNYKDKQDFFDKHSSLAFEIDKCDWKEQSDTNQTQVADMITYHIFAKTHTIEKHIPKKNIEPTKYKYVYHTVKDMIHEICTRTWIEVPNMSTSKKEDKLSSIPKGYGKTYIYPSSGYIDAYKAYYYYGEDGKLDYVVVEPKKGKGIIRRYTADNNSMKQLVNILEGINTPFLYKKDDVVIEFKIDTNQTARIYCGADQFAVLIGTMAEIGIKYVSTGCTSKDATGYPSLSHVNGYSFDFKYQKDNDQMLIDAMQKWAPTTNINVGWGTSTGKHVTGINVKPISGHESHIHWGPNKTPKISELKK
ncbi:glycoside hydrolase family 19 protein [Bacteroides sp.]